MKTILAVLLLVALTACTREAGEPDPPVRQLVPCDPAAAPDSPLACTPAPVDGGGD